MVPPQSEGFYNNLGILIQAIGGWSSKSSLNILLDA